MSNADERSSIARAPTLPRSMALTMSLWTLTRAVSVEWNLRYVDWCGDNSCSESTCSVNLESTMRSRTFDTKLKLEIGLYELRSLAERWGFFNRGRTIADLYRVGNFPCVIEALHHCYMVILSLRCVVFFWYSTSKNVVTLKSGSRSLQVIESGTVR